MLNNELQLVMSGTCTQNLAKNITVLKYKVL